MGETRKIGMTVNGKRYEAEAEVRLTLADFLRHTLGLTLPSGLMSIIDEVIE